MAPLRSLGNPDISPFDDVFCATGARGPGPTIDKWKGGRGVMFGGTGSPTPNGSNIIQYITIASAGNATDFGDLSYSNQWAGTGSSNGSRGVCMGGRVDDSARSNAVDYITFASTGNGTDWGNLYDGAWLGNYGTIGNGTRGVMVGNYSPATDTIQYITIDTTGDAGDMGNLIGNKTDSYGCSGNNDRGISAGGSPGGGVIEYFSISTTNNGVDFGDLSDSAYGGAGCDNGIRGWFVGARGSNKDRMEYITTGTLGNATDAGNLTQSFQYMSGMADQDTGRGICASNYDSPYETINYWTIMSTSNATDFGDLIGTSNQYSTAGCSGT